MNPFYFVVQRSVYMVSTLIFFFLLSSVSPSYGYDPLDPYGNITIKWDLLQSSPDRNDVKVSILNFQLYRHIERPGWRLGWDWTGDEAIWSMQGAEATEQGNCSRFRGGQLPHCCEKKPLIVDLLPGAPYNMQTTNCCKGGVLSSMIQDPTKYAAAFQMNIGAANNSDFTMPENFTLGIPGYSCAKPVQVAPSRYSSDGGRRWTQALGTWNVTCIYSQFLASTSPKCCVSFSAFYNSSIVPCPKCSCSCQGLPGATCVKFGETPSLLQQIKDPNQEPPSLVRCTQHMCPIRVHWHVKQSYKEYWRVKITVNNLNTMKNYSQWNLVALHPNLKSLTQVFSFNYEPLYQYGYINDTGMFWGIQYYNDMLLQEGESGNVQTELLLRKDQGTFTFREGWGFPRRIMFNGDECVMPPPDQYPRLPNTGHGAKFSLSVIFFSLLLLIIMC
ncbi:COBRA-like protein 6 isoform X2 [Durio zibethinus]|uniref:COBRA-like protein n=1 Tax=Durio zibethinus TaxID=66656 RepID=A0A6P6AEL5_DURZI|nr:COBRA-like protein 6 isoform X2 [Durio zibethinus]